MWQCTWCECGSVYVCGWSLCLCLHVYKSHVCAEGPQRREAEVPIEWPCSGSQAPISDHRISNLGQLLVACPVVWGPVVGMNFVRQIFGRQKLTCPFFHMGWRWKFISWGLPENTHVNPQSIDWRFLTEIQTAFVIFTHAPHPVPNWSIVRSKNSYFHIRWTEPLTPSLVWTLIV